jgi:hypothetical protein
MARTKKIKPIPAGVPIIVSTDSLEEMRTWVGAIGVSLYVSLEAFEEDNEFDDGDCVYINPMDGSGERQVVLSHVTKLEYVEP